MSASRRAILLFELMDLLHAALVSTAFKLCIHPDFYQPLGAPRAQ
jgi:hypothetical protein